MRQNFRDRGVRDRVHEVLDTSFPRLSERIGIAAAAGARWDEVSTPFVVFDDDGVAAAHVGVIVVPMMVAGRRVDVAGVHAVCTRPERRGRGHARRALDEALAFVDARGLPAMLTTSIPGLYERFGFRVVEEVSFRPRVEPVRPAAPADRSAPPRLRKLSPADDPEDRRLAWRLLGERTPVSHVLASDDAGWLLLIDEALESFGFERLWYAPDLDVLVAWEVEGGVLRLLDVVGAELPPLPDVLARIPAPWERVELCFAPDRLWDGPVDTVPWDPADRLMVRGDFPELGKVVLSPLARW